MQTATRNWPGGVIPASITPFDDRENIDINAMLTLLHWNLQQGVEGFFIGGSSAECFLLTPTERIELFAAAAQVREHAYLIAHVGDISTRQAECYAREAGRLGFDALAATPPFYYGFDSAQVCSYYYDLAQAAGKPVLIYNFPGNTVKHLNLADENYVRLLRSGAILGVKHTDQEVYQLERIKHVNPDLIVMNGYDETMVVGLALGADGSIGSTFNFMYPHYRKIYEAFHNKNIEEARTLQIKANNIMNTLCDVGLIPSIKYALSAKGIHCGVPRRPFLPLTDYQKKQIDQTLAMNLVE